MQGARLRHGAVNTPESSENSHDDGGTCSLAKGK